jgi:acetoin utilization deacetylase AcuC-like enzyme
VHSGSNTSTTAAAAAGAALQGAARPPAPTARPNVFTPTLPDVDTLCLVHDSAYVDAFLSGQLPAAEMRRIGLPWSQALVQRTLVGTGSAVLAARLALSYGVAIMCNGGTHHAHRDHGSGECDARGAAA